MAGNKVVKQPPGYPPETTLVAAEKSLQQYPLMLRKATTHFLGP